MQILLSHLHSGYHKYARLRRHREPFAVDQVRMLETSRTTTNGLLAIFRGTGVNSDRHTESVSCRGKRLHLVVKPDYASRIIT